MDTPEKKIGTSASKFEDSPVFNYINSLSPIKPVKSLHITQTFSSLSFASLPSVFTSPHVSSHKESRFLKRHSNTDPSKPEFSSDNGNRICTNEEAVVDPTELYNSSEEQHENGPLVEASADEPQSDCLKFLIELPRTLKYNCGSPECLSTQCGIEEDFASGLVDPSPSLDTQVHEAPEKGPSDVTDTQYHEMCMSGQRKEGSVCDWESLMSDTADVLIFNSPIGSEAFKGLIHNSLEPVAHFCTSFTAEFAQGMRMTDPGSSEQQTREPFTRNRHPCLMNGTEQTQNEFDEMNSNRNPGTDPSEEKDNKAGTHAVISCKSVLSLHHGIRRRCLDFEMVGARRKNVDDVSNSNSVTDVMKGTDEKQLGPLRPCSDSSRSILPGIGLHLNALAATSKDRRVIKDENLSSRVQIRMPNSTLSTLHSPKTGQEAVDRNLTSASADLDSNSMENQLLLEDTSQVAGSLALEEFNQNSPKKKRRRLENAGETEGCKRCNCKKSKCLKLYCECFAAGVYCIEPCSCQDCFNKPIHEETVLSTRKQIESRNPLAFAPKVIRSADPVPDFGDESSKTPASARHKRGCNCKKSSCLKKYCECYQGGVGCSIGCRCEGCKNTFGRKDGSSALIGPETEADDEEEESSEKSLTEKPSYNIEIHNNEEHNPNSAVPITPIRMSRSLLSMPFSSKGKPPRSSFLTVASSSSGLYGHKHPKPSILRSHSKFEKHVQTISDDEMPEILRGDDSPSTGMKTASPNSKRISPPHCHFGSPGRRSGRKLILQSIPSFPSLTPHH